MQRHQHPPPRLMQQTHHHSGNRVPSSRVLVVVLPSNRFRCPCQRWLVFVLVLVFLKRGLFFFTAAGFPSSRESCSGGTRTALPTASTEITRLGRRFLLSFFFTGVSYKRPWIVEEGPCFIEMPVFPPAEDRAAGEPDPAPQELRQKPPG